MADIIDFDEGMEIIEPDWLVEGLVPLGHLGFVLAQAGVGKSFLLEHLAACVVFGKPFLGLEVKSGNVLIIDEDTPEAVVKRRLSKFMAYFKNEKKLGTLHLQAKEGLVLSNTSLMKSIIEEKDSLRLVIIDSFNAVCGELDPNSTRSMSKIQMLKQACLEKHLTILINHHISEKTEVTTHALMTSDSHRLSMGSSVINQQADSYYILGVPEGQLAALETLYVRPVSKREKIDILPFKTKFIEENGYSYFDKLETLNLVLDLTSDTESDILALYREQDQGEQIGRTVNEIHTQLQGKHGIQAIREALKAMEISGKIRCRKTKHNLFHYEIPYEENIEWPSPS